MITFVLFSNLQFLPNLIWKHYLLDPQRNELRFFDILHEVKGA